MTVTGNKKQINQPFPTDESLSEMRREVETLRNRVEALSSLMEISAIINSTLNLDEVMMLVMEKAQAVMNAEASSVMIINEKKGVLECPVALGEVGEKIRLIELPMDKGIVGWVVQHGEPLNVPDAYQDPRFNPKVDEETGFRTRSILAAPLKVKEKLIGVAEVINRADGKAFDEDDLELFSTFCRNVALAIENARVHRLELEKQRIEQQLEAAKVIQESFMPEHLPQSLEGLFQVVARSIPAVAVGGDFYDVLEPVPRTLGVAIGDVSGKGIPAALYMARLVSDFRIHARNEQAPERVLAALNRVLSTRSRRGMFVTFFYSLLHLDTGEFHFADAGHLPFLRISRQGDSEWISGSTGIPLGISPGFPYQSGKIQLRPGDTLVFITDGIVEAKNRTGEMYSFKRVQDILSRPKLSGKDALDILLQDVYQFIGEMEQHDDVTALALGWRKP